MQSIMYNNVMDVHRVIIVVLDVYADGNIICNGNLYAISIVMCVNVYVCSVDVGLR